MLMNGSTKETDSIEYLRQRVFEMENLLNANQMLCNILDPVELYSTIGNLVKEQLKVSTIGIFIYQHDFENFELVFSHGLNDLAFRFDENKGPLWQKILQKEPFPIKDAYGNPMFKEFSENDNLKKMNSEWWFPL